MAILDFNPFLVGKRPYHRKAKLDILEKYIFFQTQNLAPSPCGLFWPWHPLKALVKTFHFYVF